ncbi:hypothetical protein ACHAWO_002872 [Cyclotella atomus]|uniref:Uncharacterized protein n=1 Tax=Cyclotella atomus TaxID=382360 RepID=A0ABD3QGV3_9STRA
METRRRSARIKSQSDDESSVSSGRRTRGTSAATAAALTDDGGTPRKAAAKTRARANSSASKASAASVETPTRRTRSSAAPVKDDGLLDVIPEVAETKDDAAATPVKKKTADNVMVTPKVDTPKKSAKKSVQRKDADEVMADEEGAAESTPVGVVEELKSTKESARKARKSSGADEVMAGVEGPDETEPNTAVEEPKSTKKSARKARKSSGADKEVMTDAKGAAETEPSSVVEEPKSPKKSARKTRKSSGADEVMTDAKGAAETEPSSVVEEPKSTKKSARTARKSSGVDQVTNEVDLMKSPAPTPAATAKKSAKKETPNKAREISQTQASTSAQTTAPTPEPSTKKKKTEKRKSMDSQTPSTTITPMKPKPQPPIFDTTIHRLRFLKLAPKSILAMASSPRLKKKNTAQLQQQNEQEPLPYYRKAPQVLAISRQGGAVELVDPAERWITVGTVPGVRDREVDALVWVCGDVDDYDSVSPISNDDTSSNVISVPTPRLIGASRDGTLFYLDFTSQRQTKVVGSGAGGVFCLASLCSKGSCCKNYPCLGYFAAGCEDGTIKLYRFDKGIELVSTLPSAGNAVLSLAWVGNMIGEDALGGSVIFAGIADGTIRRFNCVSSRVTGSISTGVVLSTDGSRRSSTGLVHRWKPTLRMVVENRGLREATKIWALQALSDGTVISGDSLGNVQFWDGMFGTMLQTFNQSENGSDVLCLAVSDDENKVFASGVDTRVMCLQRQGLASKETVVNSDAAPIRRWINVCAHRKHTHDVRALAICHKKATGSRKKMELLVSGSTDTRLCTYVTTDFRSSRPRIWFNWSSRSPISLSKDHRLIAVTRNDKVEIYQLGAPNNTQSVEERDESKCLVKTISIKSPFNLNCSTISGDGKFLAASDASALYVFSLTVQEHDGIMDLHPTKLHLPKECRRPGTSLCFDAAQRLICATVDGPINILQISASDDSDDVSVVSLEHNFKEHLRGDESDSHSSAVIGLDISLDKKWFAAARFSRNKGSVHVFSLEPFGHWWSLPEVESTATCIKFLGEASLAVGCSNNSFYIFNTQRRELSNWSHDMGLPIVKSLPKELSSRPEPLTRILLTPSMHEKLILGAHGFFCVVDLDKTVPEKSRTYPPNSLRARRSIFDDEDDLYVPPSKKRKHNPTESNNNNFTLCLRYSNVLFQEFMNQNEMVIVEEPWRSVLEELPASLSRRVYGT